jgi:broad specificity phosphatase PhoE
MSSLSESENCGFESPEKFSNDPLVTIELIRHGEAVYPNEDYLSGDVEGELTPEARDKLTEEANAFCETIDSESELACLISSPKFRACQSAEIYSQVLRKYGITTIDGTGIRDSFSTVNELRDVRVTSEYLTKITELLNNNGVGLFQHWSTDHSSTVKESGSESYEDIQLRLESFLNSIRCVASMVQPADNRKFRFLVFGHEELFDSVLRSTFDDGMAKANGVDYGERISLKLHNPNQLKFDVTFREKQGVYAIER